MLLSTLIKFSTSLFFFFFLFFSFFFFDKLYFSLFTVGDWFNNRQRKDSYTQGHTYYLITLENPLIVVLETCWFNNSYLSNTNIQNEVSLFIDVTGL